MYEIYWWNQIQTENNWDSTEFDDYRTRIANEMEIVIFESLQRIGLSQKKILKACIKAVELANQNEIDTEGLNREFCKKSTDVILFIQNLLKANAIPLNRVTNMIWEMEYNLDLIKWSTRKQLLEFVSSINTSHKWKRLLVKSAISKKSCKISYSKTPLKKWNKTSDSDMLVSIKKSKNYRDEKEVICFLINALGQDINSDTKYKFRKYKKEKLDRSLLK